MPELELLQEPNGTAVITEWDRAGAWIRINPNALQEVDQ